MQDILCDMCKIFPSTGQAFRARNRSNRSASSRSLSGRSIERPPAALRNASGVARSVHARGRNR